jgi:hypothetical protein
MAQVRRYRAFGLIAMSLMLGLMLSAQSGDPAVLQQRLSAQFKLTTTTADRTDIVAAGDVVEIRKPGLLMYDVSSPMPPSNTYKNGRISQGWSGFGKDMLITMRSSEGTTANDYQHRPFVAGEKCWVTAITVQSDGVLFQLYSDPYSDVRYYANLKVPFPDKKVVPPVDAFLQTIAEVVRGVPQDNQSGSGQTAAPGNVGAGGDPASSVSGRYIRTDKNSDFIQIGSAGTFLLFQGGKAHPGNYRIDGDSLVLSGPLLPVTQKCHLIGDTLTDPAGIVWKKQGEVGVASVPAGTSSPSGLEDIAPPAPPADAPPPTIALGQTKAQVTAGFGQPVRVAKLGVKEIYYYKDMKVTFTNGKVSNVE